MTPGTRVFPTRSNPNWLFAAERARAGVVGNTGSLGRLYVSFPIGQESSKIDNLTWFQARWFQEYAVWFLGIARNRNRPKEPDRPVEPGRFLRAWFHEYAVWLNSYSIPWALKVGSL